MTPLFPERLPRVPVSFERVCRFSDEWGIAFELAYALVRLQAELPVELWIYSGVRTRAEQARLEAEGRPAADWSASTHADTDRNGCARLATGADVQPVSPAIRASRAVQAQIGAAAVRLGLRWGGGGPVDPGTGIPVDMWHFDLGARGV